jgi:hypothetical protein
MVAPLHSRVSKHHWALSMAPETENLRTRAFARSLYAWMLSEDFSNRHYAYEMGLDYEGVEYQHGNDVVTSLLRELGQYGREHATRLFPELISTVAQGYLMYGKCMFELFVDSDSDTPGPRLGVLPGWSLKHRRGRTFQAAPRRGELEWRELPSTALIEFRLPGGLGKELYRTTKRLRVLDAHQAGDPAMLAGARSTGYDFGTHRRSLDEMAARATSSIGWDGRAAFLQRATDSHRVYRQLRFLRTWLIITSATTETLNLICNHPAVNAGTPLEIMVTGLPTIENVERSTVAVINGTESLNDISKNVLHPRRS